MTREEMSTAIARRKQEIKTAGPVHKRDLMKNIRRLQRELRDYDRFQAEARRCG